MKFFKYVLGLLIILPVTYFVGYTIYEQSFESKNYRAHNSQTHFRRALSKHCIDCFTNTYHSSDAYPFSGGGRVNFQQMETLQKNHQGPIYVVNLRDENGLYYNFHPISYYGIRVEEDGYKLRNRNKWYRRQVINARRHLDGLPESGEDLQAEEFLNEKETLHKMGIHYVKYELFRKNFSTDWEFVDRLVNLFESFPKGSWVHFHCAGGRGRTTTVAIMYDIFRNGTDAPLNDITFHHFCLGGENMMDTSLIPKGTWTKEKLEGRKALIQTFYKYMQASDGYPHKKWSTWLQDHNIPIEFSFDKWTSASI